MSSPTGPASSKRPSESSPPTSPKRHRESSPSLETDEPLESSTYAPAPAPSPASPFDSYNKKDVRRAIRKLIKMWKKEGPVVEQLISSFLEPCTKDYWESSTDSDEDDSSPPPYNFEKDSAEHAVRGQLGILDSLNTIVIFCVNKNIFSSRERADLANYLRTAPWWSRKEYSEFAISYLEK